MFIFIRKNGYYASQKRLCKQPVLRGGIFIAFSKGQFEVEKSPKIQLYQYVSGWLDTGKKFSGLIKKSACLLLPLNIGMVSPGMTTPFSSTISKVALKYCFVTFSTIISSFSDERKNPLYLSLWPFSLVNIVPFSSFACDSLSSLPL